MRPTEAAAPAAIDLPAEERKEGRIEEKRKIGTDDFSDSFFRRPLRTKLVTDLC